MSYQHSSDPAGNAAAGINAASVVVATLMAIPMLARRAQDASSHADKPIPSSTTCLPWRSYAIAGVHAASVAEAMLKISLMLAESAAAGG